MKFIKEGECVRPQKPETPEHRFKIPMLEDDVRILKHRAEEAERMKEMWLKRIDTTCSAFKVKEFKSKAEKYDELQFKSLIQAQDKWFELENLKKENNRKINTGYYGGPKYEIHHIGWFDVEEEVT